MEPERTGIDAQIHSVDDRCDIENAHSTSMAFGSESLSREDVKLANLNFFVDATNHLK
jgi:hypothetical protein